MFRRSSGSEDSGDYNWLRLSETHSRKSQRRYARAWVHSLPSDLPLLEVLVVPIHPTGPSEIITMSSNPANQPSEPTHQISVSPLALGDEREARIAGQIDGRIM